MASEGGAASAGAGAGGSKLVSIDVLRGIAAVAVMLFHAFSACFPRNTWGFFEDGPAGFVRSVPPVQSVGFGLFGLGYLGVSLFFIISGFCIHLPFAGGRKPLELKTFAVRRFFRLYPLYLLFVLYQFGLGFVMNRASGEVTVGNFVGHLLMWYYNVPKGAYTGGLNPVFWSVSIEVQFYILYALLLGVLRRVGLARVAWVWLGVGIAYYAAFYALNLRDALPTWMEARYFAPVRFGEWLLGALIAELYATKKLSTDARYRLAAWPAIWGGLGIVVLAVLLAGILRFDYRFPEPLTAVGFVCVTIGLLALEQSRPARAPSTLTRIGQWLGDRSYSLYLVHLPVFTVLTVLCTKVLRVRFGDAVPTVGVLAWAAAAVTLSVVASHVLYVLVEAPSHRLARRLSSKPAAAARASTESTARGA